MGRVLRSRPWEAPPSPSLDRPIFTSPMSTQPEFPASAQQTVSNNAVSLNGEAVTINGVKYVRGVAPIFNNTLGQYPLPCSTPNSDEIHKSLAGCFGQMAIGENGLQSQPQRDNSEPRTSVGDGWGTWNTWNTGDTWDNDEQARSNTESINTGAKIFSSSIVQVWVGAAEPYRPYHIHLPIVLELLKNTADWMFGGNAFRVKTVHVAAELNGLDLLLRYLYEKEQYGSIDFMTVRSWVDEDSVDLAYLYEAASFFKLKPLQLDTILAMFSNRDANYLLRNAEIVYQSKYFDTTFRNHFKDNFTAELSDHLRDMHWRESEPPEILQVKKTMHDILSVKSQLADDITEGLLRDFVKKHYHAFEAWDVDEDLDDDTSQHSTELPAPGQETNDQAKSQADAGDLGSW